MAFLLLVLPAMLSLILTDCGEGGQQSAGIGQETSRHRKRLVSR